MTFSSCTTFWHITSTIVDSVLLSSLLREERLQQFIQVHFRPQECNRQEVTHELAANRIGDVLAHASDGRRSRAEQNAERVARAQSHSDRAHETRVRVLLPPRLHAERTTGDVPVDVRNGIRSEWCFVSKIQKLPACEQHSTHHLNINFTRRGSYQPSWLRGTMLVMKYRRSQVKVVPFLILNRALIYAISDP